MYRLEVESSFAAAHQLHYYKGKCERLHGHNWRVRVAVEGTELDRVGLLVDFNDLKAMIGASTEKLDHGFLNDVPPFDAVNPTSENIARFIAEDMAPKLPAQVRIAGVTVWESDKCSATYLP